MKNILSAIEQAAARFPDSTAVSDETEELTYRELLSRARRIGSALAESGLRRTPTAILMDKTPACVAAMLGVLYSGNFYTVLDPRMPPERIRRIFETLRPAALIADQSRLGEAAALGGVETMSCESACAHAELAPLLDAVRQEMTAEDPMYVLYTSGSTGRPKGAVVTHRAALAYTEWAADTFGFDNRTVLGSQTPFYFSMSVTDLFGALRSGSRLQIIPKTLFSFPMQLMDYLNRYAVSAIYWVPSAMGLVAAWDTFAYAKPEHLRQALFAGEVMPPRVLAYWRRNLPKVRYANLFGPTETTDICTWFEVPDTFPDGEALPIGKPCGNCRALILDEAGAPARRGELYVAGPFLASGYYNDPEKTAAAFVQNPLNSAYPETVYRTGDLVERGADGALRYLGRLDSQIKRMGYRIEPGEIEAAALAAEGVDACAVVFDPASETLVLLYQGKAKPQALSGAVRSRVPAYMAPDRILRLAELPHNANGKIDRSWLKDHWKEY